LEDAGIEAQGAKWHGKRSFGAITENARAFALEVHSFASCAIVDRVKSTRLRVILLLFLLSAAIVSCRTAGFYTQAARGQWEVLSKSRPIPEVQADAETSPELRRKLELVEELRAFAHDVLKLPTHRQYRNYADLGRKYVVWNVVAAPEFSIEAKTWPYPFLGELKYRGFFSEQAARDEATQLKAQGYDVAVGGVRVYSTLGFFSDPVLNTFIRDEESELAETLFHELTHARLYLSGDTDFNEAYATAAGQLGVRAWLRAKGDHEALARYEARLRQASRLLGLLKETRAELKKLYATRGAVGDENVRREKASMLDAVQERYLAVRQEGRPSGPHSKWLGEKLNNARLAAVATYHDLVPDFERLFREQGEDWEAFHRAVAAMKPLSAAERIESLQSLGTPGGKRSDQS
jgi:predicted aminopeptidase